MKHLVLSVLFLMVFAEGKAQERFFLARNSIQLEVPTHTFYCLSYERIWTESKKIAWSSRIGLGAKGGTLPRHGIYFDFGGITKKKKHHFEFGFQFTYFRQKNIPDYPQFIIAEPFVPRVSTNPRLGYRFQTPNSGWIFRANAMLEFLSSEYIDGRIKPKISIPIPWPVLTIGRSF